MVENILEIDFYNRHPVDVAKDLLGKRLVFGFLQGLITETEAYRGSDDEASHAYKGLSKRNEAMFGPPGHAYVYFIYGMHYCLNIVTEGIGQPSAVLIRGLLLPENIHLNGPGKICRHFGINKEHNKKPLFDPKIFCVTEGFSPHSMTSTPRIGISKGTEKVWRFLWDAKEINFGTKTCFNL